MDGELERSYRQKVEGRVTRMFAATVRLFSVIANGGCTADILLGDSGADKITHLHYSMAKYTKY